MRGERNSKRKIFTWRINLFIFTIFALGAMFGVLISDFSVSSLEGYLFSNAHVLESDSYVNVYATGSNATSANATSSNATSSNATSSNATSSNATSSNAAGDLIYLAEISGMRGHKVKVGEKVYLNFSTAGNCLNGATLTLANREFGFSTKIEYESDGRTYFTIPEEVPAGTYSLIQILLVGDSNLGGTFTRVYTVGEDLDIIFALIVEKDENVADIVLNNLTFEATEINLDEELYFTIDTDAELVSARFTFKNIDTAETITSYMKEEDGKKYLTFASNTRAGKYEIYNVALTSADTTTVYTKDGSNSSKKYDFNTTITLNEVETKNLEYNNEDINDEIISEIKNAKNGKTITINADAKSIISSDVFEAVKGTSKKLVINYKNNQIIFNGSKITTAKDIDVSMRVYSLSSTTKDTDIQAFLQDGIVVAFADNGNLPGKATVRIKQTNVVKNVLEGKSIYVYYFDEATQMFEKVASNIKLKDGYYEFELTHNSRFVMTNLPIDENLVQESTDDVVNFVMDDKIYLVLIILAVLLIVLVVAIIVVYVSSKSSKGAKTVVVNNETKAEEGRAGAAANVQPETPVEEANKEQE